MSYTREDAIKEIAEAFMGPDIDPIHCRAVLEIVMPKLKEAQGPKPVIPPDLGITIIKHLCSLGVVKIEVTQPEIGREIQSKLSEIMVTPEAPVISPELKEAMEPILEFVKRGRAPSVDDDNEVLRYRYGDDFRVVTIGDLRRIAKLMEPDKQKDDVVKCKCGAVAGTCDCILNQVVDSVVSGAADKLDKAIMADQHISNIAEKSDKSIADIAEGRAKILEDRAAPAESHWRCSQCHEVSYHGRVNFGVRDSTSEGLIRVSGKCRRCGSKKLEYKKVAELPVQTSGYVRLETDEPPPEGTLTVGFHCEEYWQCDECHNVQFVGREIRCWRCGKGSMEHKEVVEPDTEAGCVWCGKVHTGMKSPCLVKPDAESKCPNCEGETHRVPVLNTSRTALFCGNCGYYRDIDKPDSEREFRPVPDKPAESKDPISSDIEFLDPTCAGCILIPNKSGLHTCEARKGEPIGRPGPTWADFSIPHRDIPDGLSKQSPTDPDSYNFCPACGKKKQGEYTNGKESVRDSSCHDCRTPFWWPGCGKSRESFDRKPDGPAMRENYLRLLKAKNEEIGGLKAELAANAKTVELALIASRRGNETLDNAKARAKNLEKQWPAIESLRKKYGPGGQSIPMEHCTNILGLILMIEKLGRELK